MTRTCKNIVKYAWVELNLLRAIKFKLCRHAIEGMYISFIRPFIEYSDAVWDNCSKKSKIQLDLIHHEADRIINWGTKLCGIQKLLSELGLILYKTESLNINLLSLIK